MTQQRSLLALAALTLCAATAQAQSNVTLYGRINLTVESQKLVTGDSNTSMVNSSSRWGLKGSEDLGGGLTAGFVLESGFNPANGNSAAPFWGRQSEVNLAGKWGMVRLGNFTSEAYYATADYVGLHNHDTGTSSDALYAYLGRNNSKIAYRAPAMGGLTFEIATALKSGGGAGAKDTLDLALNYDSGPLHLGFGYEKNDDFNQFAARALYELGAFTVGGYIQRDDNDLVGHRNTYRLAGMYTMGGSEFHLSVGRAGSYSDAPGTSATQTVLGYNYNVSKRTKFYGFVTRLSGDARDAYALNVGGVRNAFAVGVRHNF